MDRVAFSRFWTRLCRSSRDTRLGLNTRSFTYRPHKRRICHTRCGLDKRHVTAAEKRDVEKEYHFKKSDCPSGRVDIDHLISRELGGADDVKNLWPQCYKKHVAGKHPSQVKEWGAYKKDRHENRLHKEMCAGHVSFKAARDAEVNDWRVAYKKYFGEP